jgi:hypothetical protein
MLFNPELRDVGDGEWVLRLLQRGTPMAVLRRFTSAFTMTGVNMSARPNARREAQALFQSAPPWARRLRWLIIAHHRVRRLAGGIYFQPPFSYAIYSRQSPTKRVIHQVEHPRFRWQA